MEPSRSERDFEAYSQSLSVEEEKRRRRMMQERRRQRQLRIEQEKKRRRKKAAIGVMSVSAVLLLILAVVLIVSASRSAEALSMPSTAKSLQAEGTNGNGNANADGIANDIAIDNTVQIVQAPVSGDSQSRILSLHLVVNLDNLQSVRLSLLYTTIGDAAFYVSDADGNVLLERNGDESHYPASMTKLLTAIVAIEKSGGDLSRQVTIGDISDSHVEDSMLLYLEQGEKTTLEELLNAMLIGSYNDAASAIACYIGGDVSTFAGLMNQEAAQIGCTSSHFVTPSGLHDSQHYTTPHDMNLILRKAVTYPQIVGILETEEYTITLTESDGSLREEEIETTNPFINHTYSVEGFQYVGGKTGYTPIAEHCLNSEFVSDDGSKTVYVTVMYAEDAGLVTKYVMEYLY